METAGLMSLTRSNCKTISIDPYRNKQTCSSAPRQSRNYTVQLALQVKKTNGVPATWFDIWDLGKAHARLGHALGLASRYSAR